MSHFPAIVVHGLDDARRALAPGLPLTLLSAPGAAGYAGCGFWRALAAAARALPGGASVRGDTLDCGDSAGYALAALGLGLRTIVLDSRIAAFASVVATAAETGATVLAARPPALDMRDWDSGVRLAIWLHDDRAAPLG